MPRHTFACMNDVDYSVKLGISMTRWFYVHDGVFIFSLGNSSIFTMEQLKLFFSRPQSTTNSYTTYERATQTFIFLLVSFISTIKLWKCQPPKRGI